MQLFDVLADDTEAGDQGACQQNAYDAPQPRHAQTAALSALRRCGQLLPPSLAVIRAAEKESAWPKGRMVRRSRSFYCPDGRPGRVSVLTTRRSRAAAFTGSRNLLVRGAMDTTHRQLASVRYRTKSPRVAQGRRTAATWSMLLAVISGSKRPRRLPWQAAHRSKARDRQECG